MNIAHYLMQTHAACTSCLWQSSLKATSMTDALKHAKKTTHTTIILQTIITTITPPPRKT